MMEILSYSKNLKCCARALRANMTPAEKVLWGKLRRRQINNTQFLRQKPILSYIVDFYAKFPRLAIEVDGGIHDTLQAASADQERDLVLQSLGIQIMRFSNDQVLHDLSNVLSKIKEKILESTI